MADSNPKRNNEKIIESIDVDSGQTLRERAEEQCRPANQELSSPPPEDSSLLLHELQVHQIELEMQNEELRRSQHELSASRARYFDLYDMAPAAYLTISDQGLILESNLTAAVLLGSGNRSALIKTPLTYFIAPADQDIYYFHRKNLVDTGAPQVCELRIKRADESESWVRMDGTLAVDATTGKTICRVILTDITERKRSEKEKEQLQEQLVQAAKMESIGRLAGGVAHEFNNMLGVIQGNAELALERAPLDAPLHSLLVHIIKAAQRSAKITGQLLAFAHKQHISPKIIDLNAALEGMLNMIEQLIGEGIDLVWRPKERLWPIEIDPIQIHQILMNLCLNARDAIEGKGKIIVETENVSFDETHCKQHTDCMPGEYVVLNVCDNGRGIDEELLDQIFEPFFTTKDVNRGTGLGLATVHGIVRQNNGFIKVISSSGQGTIFKVHLPRHTGPVVETKTESAEIIPRGHGETLLLVEDEPALLEIAAKILQNLGYTILPSNTPAKAIRLAEEHEIHLLVTDMLMPGMNGKELSNQLMAQHKGLKCLIMSGYSANIIPTDSVLDSSVDFIQKPFAVKEMAIKIRTLLEQ